MIDIKHLVHSEWYTTLVNELAELESYFPKIKWIIDKNYSGLLKINSTNLRDTIIFYWSIDANITCCIPSQNFDTENCSILENCIEIANSTSIEYISEKVIRNGNVAVIVNHSGKWFSEHEIEDLLYCPPLVEVLTRKDYDYSEVIQSLLEFGCELKKEDTLDDLELVTHLVYKKKEIEISQTLKVVWIKEGTTFRIDWLIDDEQEVWEMVEVFNPNQWLTA